MIRIYIARHGETTWNVEMRVQGRSDPGLTGKGYDQRMALLERLKGRLISAIYTSSLQRSVLTAQPTAEHLDLPIQRRPELDEMDFGIWEGRQPADFDEEERSQFSRFRTDRLNYRIPGGESYEDVALRLRPFIEEILQGHQGQEILIVGHRGANRMLIGLLLDFPLERATRIDQSNDCIYLIEKNGKPKVSHDVNGECREGLLLEGERVIL